MESTDLSYMTSLRLTLRGINRNRSGATAVEFALVFPIYIVIVLTALELGLIFYHTVIIEDAMLRATREAKIGVSGVDGVRQKIRDYAVGIINPQALQITNAIENTDFDADYSSDPAEPCIDASGVPNGQTCPCTGSGRFRDDNGNGICDAGPPPLETGGPGQVIIYNAIYDWQIISPITNLMMRTTSYQDENGTVHKRNVFRIITAGAVRNEPFGP